MTEHDCGRLDPECPGCAADQHAADLTEAIRALAHGGIGGPTGFEALVMAIIGSGGSFDRNLVSAIDGHGTTIATALDNVAEALSAIATALSKQATDGALHPLTPQTSPAG